MNDSPVLKVLNIQRRYLRSAHLERDFTDASALCGYILTGEAKEHLARLSSGLKPESGQRSWRITGDYGSGKSSFALLLAQLLSGNGSTLPTQLRSLPKELGLSRQNVRLLPVLVTGSREPIAHAVLRSLAQAVEDAAVKQRTPIRNKLAKALADLDAVTDQQVLNFVTAVAQDLVSRKHASGLLVILDELGKFLEFSALHPERQDVYFLQQLGEMSARSKDTPVFTVGLLHQGFAAYADKLSDQAQREWEKVAGRFEELVFSQPMAQISELVAAALGVSAEDCPKQWTTSSRIAMRDAIALGLFGSAGNKKQLEAVAPQLYPLHPTLLPVAVRFFRRFGQNERSLFSFLLSSEPFGLMDFASRATTPAIVYTLSDFYDYVAQNFAPRLSAQSFRSHWNYIDALIRSFPEGRETELRVLKAVGILNVLELPELAPTDDLIALALAEDTAVKNALNSLKSAGILHYRGARSGYALWPHTSINLESAFASASESIVNVQNLAQEVQTRLDARPLVARAHYIRTGTLRTFSIYFTSSEEVEGGFTDIQACLPSEGIIAIILNESLEQQERGLTAAKKIVNRPEVIFGISQPLESLRKLVLELQRWHWIETHIPGLKDDRYAAEEVSRQIRTTEQSLDSALRRLVGFRDTDGSTNMHWVHQGKLLAALEGEHSLQSYISNFFDTHYSQAPKVHNELINRHQISAAAASARQKLYKAMVESSHLPDLGLPVDKAPPEKSMYLSVLRASGVHKEVADSWIIHFPDPGASDPNNLRPALDAIVSELERVPDARVPVDQIYKALRKPPYGVRDGLSSLLLVIAIRYLIGELAVYEDGRFVPQVDEFLLTRLTKAPHTFEFQLCRLTGIRRELLSELATVVATDGGDTNHLLSIVRPLCTFVAELPEYARNTDKLSPEALKLRSEILSAKEPADLVFRGVPEALGLKPETLNKSETTSLAGALENKLLELRRAFPELQARMAAKILEGFDADQPRLEAWRQSMAPRAESVVLGLTEPEMRAFTLKLLDEVTPQGEWLEALGSFLVRCPPSRWKDKDEAAFGDRLNEFAGKFRRIEATQFGPESIAPEDSVRVALTRKTGEELDTVVHLSSKQARAAADLRKQLDKSLSADKNVTIAALTHLLWETLGEEE